MHANSVHQLVGLMQTAGSVMPHCIVASQHGAKTRACETTSAALAHLLRKADGGLHNHFGGVQVPRILQALQHPADSISSDS